MGHSVHAIADLLSVTVLILLPKRQRFRGTSENYRQSALIAELASEREQDMEHSGEGQECF